MRTETSFLKGTLLLTLSGVTVKIFGAVFRIILTNYVGSAAMGFYSSAYAVYLFLFSLSSAGIPTGISALISHTVAVGRHRDAERIFKISAFIFILFGTLLSALGMICAYPLAVLMNSPDAYPAMLAIMPAVFFISAAAVFKGYFQGYGSMMQTSVANLIEGGSKTVFGFLGAYYCASRGYSDGVTVGGAILGVTVGTVFALIYMLIKYAFRDRDISIKIPNFLTEKFTPTGTLTLTIAKATLPVSATSVTTSLMGAADAFIVMNRLKAYLPEDTAKMMWGAYGNMALTLFNLPAFMITSIGISLVPAIASAFAASKKDETKATAENAFVLASVLAFGAAIGLFILSKPILTLLFPTRPDEVAVASPLLSVIALAIISVGMANVSASALQATGNAPFTAVSAAVGCLIKTAATFILVSIPSVNILGAALATNIAYPVIVLMNTVKLKKKADIGLSFTAIVLKPLLAAVTMGIIAFSSFFIISRYIPEKTALFPCITLSILVYIALIQGFKIFDICEFIRNFHKT